MAADYPVTLTSAILEASLFSAIIVFVKVIGKARLVNCICLRCECWRAFWHRKGMQLAELWGCEHTQGATLVPANRNCKCELSTHCACVQLWPRDSSRAAIACSCRAYLNDCLSSFQAVQLTFPNHLEDPLGFSVTSECFISHCMCGRQLQQTFCKYQFVGERDWSTRNVVLGTRASWEEFP